MGVIGCAAYKHEITTERKERKRTYFIYLTAHSYYSSKLDYKVQTEPQICMKQDKPRQQGRTNKWVCTFDSWITLTLSTPSVPNCCCPKGSATHWSNPSFLIFDIRALWRSVLSAALSPERQSARMSKINNRLCYCRGTARRATSVEILWPFFWLSYWQEALLI